MTDDASRKVIRPVPVRRTQGRGGRSGSVLRVTATRSPDAGEPAEMKGAVAGLSGSLALGLLLPMEAGGPIPVPADLVMFTVGERVAAGKFPLWLALAGFEVIAVLGTTALFMACRGPAQRIITRFGPRLGLTEARLSRAAAFAETRGRPGLALGRGTPGLRTI